MSRELHTTVSRASMDEDDAPEGMMLVGALVPLSEARVLRLGAPITIVIPEGPQ